jgi:hypothetical protein
VKRKKKPQTDPPDDLTEREWNLLWAWAEQREPWCLTEVGEIGDLVARCLDYHRHQGNLGADWLAAVRNWIRNERVFRQRRKGHGPVSGQARGRSVAGAAAAVARRLGLEEGPFEGDEVH